MRIIIKLLGDIARDEGDIMEEDAAKGKKGTKT